jgi:hypothetical protein
LAPTYSHSVWPKKTGCIAVEIIVTAKPSNPKRSPRLMAYSSKAINSNNPVDLLSMTIKVPLRLAMKVQYTTLLDK